jgi:outer membrane immunogenic protein
MSAIGRWDEPDQDRDGRLPQLLGWQHFNGRVLHPYPRFDPRQARLRLGPVLMIYGTGGAAFGNFDADFQLAVFSRRFVMPFSASDNFSPTRVGWTAGGGTQYAVIPNWWVFVEYRFSDFGTLRSGAFPNLPTGVFFNGSRRFQENQVQAGFSYNFDLLPSPPPVVSKY